MVDYTVPFMSNSSDDMHCLQASLAMIRQYFDPMTEIEWDEWDELTGFVSGKGTWSNAGLMWFKENGYDVVHIGTFDYKEFAAKGTDYLIESLGEHVGAWEAEFIPDIEAEKSRTLRFSDMGVWLKRQPTLDDIYSYLNDGYLIKCLVNLNALNNLPGYLGHAVVVKGYTEDAIIVHDPGLPAIANRQVPIETFKEAWGSASSHSLKIDAIKKIAPVSAQLPVLSDNEPQTENELAYTSSSL